MLELSTVGARGWTSMDALLEEIWSARTSYDVFKVMKRLITGFGLNFFIVFQVSPGWAETFSNRALLSNWDSELLHHCIETGCLTKTEFFASLHDNAIPKSRSISDYLRGEVEAAERASLSTAIENGHDTIAFFPLTSNSGRNGVIMMSGVRPVLSNLELMELDYVLKHLFEKLMQVFDGAMSPDNPLSTRERECLRAAASGLSAAAVARELGITAHTVNYHCNNAVRKLDARNRTHAVAKAIQNGWLGPTR